MNDQIMKIGKGQLCAFLDCLSDKMSVYLPVTDADGEARYKKYSSGTELSDKVNTVRSAKDFFFPQTENIIGFNVKGKNIELFDTRSETEDFVIFGVRACDAASFPILDKVFLSDPVDTFYKARREHGVVITMACADAEDTCFCQTFGTDPSEPGGDISAWTLKDRILFRANTEKGERLLDSVDMLEKAGAEELSSLEKEQTRIKELMKTLPLADLTTGKFDGADLLETFNSPKWKELSAACLGCGTCTFVCPTCQCYDIREFDTGNGIRRFRCWDSCMYSDFTKMAAENPRHTQLERFRQRFMHKLVYFPQNNDGVYGCVGCGRCLAKCPISMNIVKVMKVLVNKD